MHFPNATNRTAGGLARLRLKGRERLQLCGTNRKLVFNFALQIANLLMRLLYAAPEGNPYTSDNSTSTAMREPHPARLDAGPGHHFFKFKFLFLDYVQLLTMLGPVSTWMGDSLGTLGIIGIF